MEVKRYNKDDEKGIFGLEYPFFSCLNFGRISLGIIPFSNLFFIFLAVGDNTTHGNCRLTLSTISPIL